MTPASWAETMNPVMEPSRSTGRARSYGVLYDHETHLTRTDLWAWQDAVSRIANTTDGARRPTEREIVAAMRRPGFYGEAENVEVEVRETHISWVFLVGARAFKLKKRVVFPFLDYGSVERRQSMCELEVELNRRLAPSVYVGVRPVVERGGHVELGTPGCDGALEHVVEMRRFDESRTLAATVASGTVEEGLVARLGARLAAFHGAAVVPSAVTEPLGALKAIGDANFEAMIGRNDLIERGRVAAAQRFVDAFLCGHAETIVGRVANGRLREGHGDLRAEHILLCDPPARDEWEIVDCAEFDASLRDGDVAADLAFLVMDLTWLGRRDLARELLDGYRSAGGDAGGDELVAFHAAVKAWVRAKVALLRASDPGRSSRARRSAEREAQELFALGERFAWQARMPLALLVCGAPAAGKSSLAARLAASSGLPVVSSDVVRKERQGLTATARAGEAAYADAENTDTYRELGRRAAEEVASNGGVIVDATFAAGSLRRAFAQSFASAAPTVFCECRLPIATIRRRALTRMSDPNRVSDATPAVAERLALEFEPLDGVVPAGRHMLLQADQPVDEITADVVALLDRRLMHGPDISA